MPANTPQGFPYPLPTEPVAEGAQAIRNLAEALVNLPIKFAEIVMPPTLVTIDFQNIPQTHRHLKILLALAADNIAGFALRFNADAGANYHWQEHRASAAAVTAAEGVGGTSGRIGWTPTPGRAMSMEIVIPNYRDTSLLQGAHSNWGEEHSPAATNIIVGHHFVSWNNAAAITRIQLFSESALGLTSGRASLYGYP